MFLHINTFAVNSNLKLHGEKRALLPISNAKAAFLLPHTHKGSLVLCSASLGTAGVRGGEGGSLHLPKTKPKCHRMTAGKCLRYLAKVPDIKKVKGVEQFALLHSEWVAARQQERPDILQAQELHLEDKITEEKTVNRCVAPNQQRSCVALINDLAHYYSIISHFLL